MKPSNPFLISGYYSPEYFCDREAETATVLDALENGRNLTLIAPRRMGKTGLIHQAFHILKEQQKDVATFYMDIYSTRSLSDFVQIFASTILGQFDPEPHKTLARLGKVLRMCRPVLTVDEQTGVPKLTVDIAPDKEEHSLKEIFDYLASIEKRCYIAIDEFQQIAEYPEKGVEALLRSYIQFVPNINFIFAGSKQHVMSEMFASSKRPFYQSTQLLSIGTIGKDSYAAFATGKFAAKGITLSAEVFDVIYDKFEGHTWYVQAILNRLYGYGKTPDNSLVGYAINQIVDEMSYTYADLCKSQTSGSLKLLKAIANEGCVAEITAGDFIARYRLRAASSISTALKKLVANEIVYPSDNGYTVYDRFLAEWLRRQPF